MGDQYASFCPLSFEKGTTFPRHRSIYSVLEEFAMKDLQILEHSGIRVMTTEQLAEAYGCDVQHIKQNFNNNKDRFTEGKHYFRLEGSDLKGFKRQVENFDLPVSKFASTIYLWTKRGAARHCKMLGTNRA